MELNAVNRDRLIEWKMGDILRIYIKDKMVKEIQIHNMDSFYQNPLEYFEQNPKLHNRALYYFSNREKASQLLLFLK